MANLPGLVVGRTPLTRSEMLVFFGDDVSKSGVADCLGETVVVSLMAGERPDQLGTYPA
jgi:hypothetical protein